jgi:hypothetical protein
MADPTWTSRVQCPWPPWLHPLPMQTREASLSHMDISGHWTVFGEGPSWFPVLIQNNLCLDFYSPIKDKSFSSDYELISPNVIFITTWLCVRKVEPREIVLCVSHLHSQLRCRSLTFVFPPPHPPSSWHPCLIEQLCPRGHTPDWKMTSGDFNSK